MKFKKVMAVILAATMVVGSSVTAFADDPAPTDANGATGSGTAFDHVNKEIISVTLPTTDEVQNVFNYYVDPERLINDAGTLADGSTAVEGNDEGVYFKNSGSGAGGSAAVDASVTAYSFSTQTSAVTSGLTVTVPTTTTATSLTYKTIVDDQASDSYVTADGWYDAEGNKVLVTIEDDTHGSIPTLESGDTITVDPYQAAQPGSTGGYSNSSDAVTFEGKNSVDVDVSVKATVTATNAEKDIALVANEDALEAATAPALLMTLKVGTDEKAITSEGATASANIAGVPTNFAVTTEGNQYVYKIHPDENNGGTALAPWGSTTVQLSGKTNEADVPEGEGAMTAPQIALTWKIAKHSDAPQAYTTATTVSSAAKALTLNMPTGVSVSKVELVLNGNTITLANGNHYSISGSTLTIGKYAAGWAGGTINITYSDDHVDSITCQ